MGVAEAEQGASDCGRLQGEQEDRATGPATPGGRSWGPGAGHGGPEHSPASWVSSRGDPSSLEPRWFPEDRGTGAGWLLPLPGRVQGAAVVSPTDPPGDHPP